MLPRASRMPTRSVAWRRRAACSYSSRKARSRASAGLLGFYMGAFKVAADANLPVVPGILRGVRTLLRGDQWFPRRTPVSVDHRGADPAKR